MGKTVCVVLGANGFVGSHLVDRLAAEPDIAVRAFDRYTRPRQFATPRAKMVQGNVGDDDALAKVLAGATYVIHCFSITTPFTADADPYADIANLTRSVQIFDMCVRFGVKKVVFISSGGSVYGRLAETNTATEMDAPMPVSPYGIGKLSIEHYLEYFKRKHGLDYIAYRLTNPYGPRQVMKHNQGVIPSFIESFMRHKTITVYGDGSASRDYIFIGDAVDMIARSFRASNAHSVYNIGSGQQTTLNDIIGTLKSAFKKEVPISYQPEPKTFLQKTDVSTERFTQEFGITNIRSLKDGIVQTLMHHGIMDAAKEE